MEYSVFAYISVTAYSKSLKPYHGWVVRGVFAVSIEFARGEGIRTFAMTHHIHLFPPGVQLVFQGGYHPCKTKHVIRVIFQDQTMYGVHRLGVQKCPKLEKRVCFPRS